MIVESPLLAQKEVNEALRQIADWVARCEWCDDCAAWHPPSDHTKFWPRFRAWWLKVVK